MSANKRVIATRDNKKLIPFKINTWPVSKPPKKLPNAAMAALDPAPDGLAALQAALAAVNDRLWTIEDAIREKEAAGSFDADFIALARSVYQQNDERGRIKRAINDLLGSRLVEQKQYSRY